MASRRIYAAICKANTVAVSMKKTDWFIIWKMAEFISFTVKVIMMINNSFKHTYNKPTFLSNQEVGLFFLTIFENLRFFAQTFYSITNGMLNLTSYLVSSVENKPNALAE